MERAREEKKLKVAPLLLVLLLIPLGLSISLHLSPRLLFPSHSQLNEGREKKEWWKKASGTYLWLESKLQEWKRKKKGKSIWSKHAEAIFLCFLASLSLLVV